MRKCKMAYTQQTKRQEKKLIVKKLKSLFPSEFLSSKDTLPVKDRTQYTPAAGGLERRARVYDHQSIEIK